MKPCLKEEREKRKRKEWGEGKERGDRKGKWGKGKRKKGKEGSGGKGSGIFDFLEITESKAKGDASESTTKDYSWGCKNGSAGKNSSCSSRRLDFDSQLPHQVAPSHLQLQP